MKKEDIKNRLKKCGLRVTPQRMAVMEAVESLHNHPTAEEISRFIHLNNPTIATGTVYKTLDTLVEKELIKRVKTDRDIMRYDSETGWHHHLYCAISDRIEDYYDDELNELLERYFEKKKIGGFDIEEIKLQIIGKFPDCDQEKHSRRNIKK